MREKHQSYLDFCYQIVQHREQGAHKFPFSVMLSFEPTNKQTLPVKHDRVRCSYMLQIAAAIFTWKWQVINVVS